MRGGAIHPRVFWIHEVVRESKKPGVSIQTTVGFFEVMDIAMNPVFRLFVDEVGHASMKATEHPNERYLSLTGVIMKIQDEEGTFKRALEALKNEIFGTTNIVLHRNEIVYRREPFGCLRDDSLRTRFDAAALDLIEKQLSGHYCCH